MNDRTGNRILRFIKRKWVRSQNNIRIRKLAKSVKANQPELNNEPVIMFNASTRLSGLSLNAGFALLTAWGLRLQGVPVYHFVCNAGMSRCIHGTNRNAPHKEPPCVECIAQSKSIFYHSQVIWFSYTIDKELKSAIADLPLDELLEYQYNEVPLGSLVLPSVRWVLRRYHLQEDEETLFIFRQYILSAWNIFQKFNKMLDKIKPGAVIIFNGIVYPEATVRWAAEQRDIRVISHEVCLQPFSAFFTNNEATFRTFEIPDSFELSDKQSQILDQYLEKRFQGDFRMAGIQFWPEMKKLDNDFIEYASQFKQIVPIFTNVIFDTSQDHANQVFDHMFDWLDKILILIQQHPETLFVIRAHPDEGRSGKESLESVASWIERHNVSEYSNVVFVGSNEYISSYELIQRSKFVMIYTSTIGLEATLMGVPVLCGGYARFNRIPTVEYPSSPEDYCKMAEEFLNRGSLKIKKKYLQNARKYLYYELFKASLPFEDYLEEDGIWKGYVSLKDISIEDLLPEKSSIMKTIIEGVIGDKPFMLE